MLVVLSFSFFLLGGDSRPGNFLRQYAHGNKAAKLRGGAWNNNSRNARASNRNRNEPANRNNNIGVRCAGIRALSSREDGQSRVDSVPRGTAAPASGLWSRRAA